MPERTDLDHRKLAELWNAGMGGDRIAIILGCSKNTVFAHAAKLGLPKRTVAFRGLSRKPWTKVTAKEVKRMRELQSQGKRGNEIAAILNRSESSVWRILGDYSERGAEEKPFYGRRKCLNCGHEFERDGPHMFMCLECRKAA